MNLANLQGKMSRNEMKQIMAGSGGGFVLCSTGLITFVGCFDRMVSTYCYATCSGTIYCC